MAFIVVFQSEGRESACAQHGTLTDAVQFVEQLRNERGIDDARIFRADEVPFDFRPYFRVEIGAVASNPPRASRRRHDVADATPDDAAALTEPNGVAGAAPPLVTAPPRPVREAEPRAEGATMRRGLFGR